MIKKINWDESLIHPKKDENVIVLNFGDFYLRVEKEDNKIKKVLLLGHNVIDLRDYNILELTFQKMYKEIYIESQSIDTEIYQYDCEVISIVSILTVESLMAFKYTESINLISFAFEEESIALMFLKTIEDLRFQMKEQELLELANDIEEINGG